MPPETEIINSYMPTPLEALGLVAACVACLVLMYATVVFLIAQLKKDNSVMDIFYGPAFAFAVWLTMYLLGTPTDNPVAILVGIVITIWAARLSLRILSKNWGRPEDQRYAAWRSAWMAKGSLYFLLRSYLQINVLQGVIITLVLSPAILLLAFGSELSTESPFVWIGLLVWLTGLTLEATADWQLDQFIARKKAGTDLVFTEASDEYKNGNTPVVETATLMTQGLFQYSRRPNYFGESLIWWGLAIVALPLPYGYLGLIAPILITFILTRVTGPMLEDIFLEKYPEEYRAYMASTSYFVPWWPKQ